MDDRQQQPQTPLSSSSFGSKNDNNNNNTGVLIVRCNTLRDNSNNNNNSITDPKELYTIIIFSLRQLYGELESYSYNIIVNVYDTDHNIYDIPLVTLSSTKQSSLPRPTSQDSYKTTSYFTIKCSSSTKYSLLETIQAIRTALTIITLPPYYSSNNYDEDFLYQFDVIKVII